MENEIDLLHMNEPVGISFDRDEFEEISDELRKFHSIFYTIWNIGMPFFTEEIPTAAVSFGRSGKPIVFKFNPTFWKERTKEQKRFVISHECLHIIFLHGLRAFARAKAYEANALNVACDIVINHGLVANFGFIREEIDPDKKYCWIDTIFTNSHRIPTSRNFEYYYNLIKQINQHKKDRLLNSEPDTNRNKKDEDKVDTKVPYDPESNEMDYGGQYTVDEHNFDEIDERSLRDMKEIFSSVEERMSSEDKKFVNRIIDNVGSNYDWDNKFNEMCKTAGTTPSGTRFKIKVKKDKTNRKFEEIVKNWAIKYITESANDQWARLNRRFELISRDFFIPSDHEIENEEKQKILVYFFMDTSGSCIGWKERFFKVALSLDPSKFEVKALCFDTQVYETTIQSRNMYGGGGTSFQCMENYIQMQIKRDNMEYPKAVFVITDGYGDKVTAENPKHWHWFLQGMYPDQLKAYYVQKDANVYDLRKFS